MKDKIGLDGSEFKRGDFDDELAEIFSAENGCSIEQNYSSQKEDSQTIGDIADGGKMIPDKGVIKV